MSFRIYERMRAVSPAIRPALVPPRRTEHLDHARLPFGSVATPQLKRRQIVLTAAAALPSIDYGDPDWKAKYRDEFEERFRIPHFTDVLDDAVSYPSTFCLRMRYVMSPASHSVPVRVFNGISFA